MSDKVTPQQVSSAATDAQAFDMTAAFNRFKFVKSLLDDPLTSVFDRRVVAWLMTAVENMQAQQRHDEYLRLELEKQLSAAPNVMPKSKALVKQAKMISRLADAVTDVVELHENYTDGTQTDSDAFESLLYRLREWEEKHEATIEAARDE